MTYDFGPSCALVRDLVAGTTDDQLGAPTPCPDYTVGDLADHLVGLTLAFSLSARKQPLPGGGQPSADASALPADWRDQATTHLADLEAGWADPAAYDGMTQAGPVELPGAVAAQVALNEVVVHGWDLAVATGQDYDPDPTAVETCLEFVSSFEPPEGGAADDGGLFGPPVPVPDDAPALHRLLGLAGRDPGWAPA
jgi:uncharacterized protein (TIGR03086 family)